MNKIGIGIIGDGIRASGHAHFVNLDPSFSLVSVAPSSRKGGEEMMKSHFPFHIDSDPQFLLERDEIDAVVLCLGTGENSRYIRYALSYAKAVVADCPLALSSSVCSEILHLAEDGEYIFYANPFLYHPVMTERKNRVPSFSLSLSSVYMTSDEMLEISLEVLVMLYGRIREARITEAGSSSVVLRIRLEKSDGTVRLSKEGHYGLSLTEDGRKVLENAPYCDSLPYFYSYLYSRLSSGGETESRLRAAAEASSAVERFLT